MSLIRKNYAHYVKSATKTNISLVIYLVVFFACSYSYANPSTAFFYGKPVPVDLMAHFEQVVVEPDNIDNVQQLTAKGITVFAYLSVGEINQNRPWYSEIPKNWLLGENKAWNSSVVDLSKKEWQDYFINKLVAPLWERGYRGFFLDTLDSYQLMTEDPKLRLVQQQALLTIIRTMHHRFPDIKLILNRGFELFPEVANYAVAVAAESLFQRWDAASESYSEVPKPDQDWLLNKLNQIHDKYGLQIIVIDYVPPAQRELARAVAARITVLGFTPWVSNPSMDMLGIGSLEVFPRRILALYDGQEQPDGLQNSNIHKLLAMPLEYLGYTLEYVDVRKNLPSNCLAGQYAGIVTWFNSDEWPQSETYKTWLSRQMDDGIKVVVLGKLGFKADSVFLRGLGLKTVSANIEKPLKISYSDDFIGYEAKPYPKLRGLTQWEAVEPTIKQHLSIIDKNGLQLTTVLTAKWGGVALHPYVIETGFEGKQRWLINPFKFLTQALDLPSMPVPDVTTENGKRLLLVQIDGDGASLLAEMPNTPLAIEVIRDQILQVYQWPTTVSVIESKDSALPDKAAQLEKIRQVIFKLDNVETVNHSYSSNPAVETSITRSESSITRVPPQGYPVNNDFQVYAPMASDYIYTNQWNGDFSGMRQAIETFQLTDLPFRLKPIHIHYHFYSGSKIASIAALKEVYDWTAKQKIYPLSISEYIRKINAFQHISIARNQDGSWDIRGLGDVRTLRLPSTGSPNLQRSKGVTDIYELPQGRYISLLPINGKALLYIDSSSPTL